MAYIGVRLDDIGRTKRVTAKLHGPIEYFGLDISKVRETVTEVMESETVFNIWDRSRALSEKLVDEYCDGKNVLWAEVEIIMPNGYCVGSSAEGVNV